VRFGRVVDCGLRPGNDAITLRPVSKREELIERTREELMQEAASDELFLADLNETMEDFGPADQEDNEILTMDRLAG